jgi:hypothetical protein
LTPRFTPALDTTTSRYLQWFNVSLQNAEQFHALIALSSMYENIDKTGFGQPHWRSLYHRGESLRLLRSKVEGSMTGDDDASILTALWLLDIEVSPSSMYVSMLNTTTVCTRRAQGMGHAQESERADGGE